MLMRNIAHKLLLDRSARAIPRYSLTFVKSISTSESVTIPSQARICIIGGVLLAGVSNVLNR